MTTNQEALQPIEKTTALGRIDERLERIEHRLRRIEAEILAAKNRHVHQRATLVGVHPTTDEAHRAAEAEWRRVEGAGRRALLEEERRRS
jgi:hypothetical protein